MKYLALVYGDGERFESLPDAEREEVYERYRSFAAEAKNTLTGGAELAGPRSATTVRVRNGDTQVTDGPFAETREQLGGFFVFECLSMDEAVELAARIPGAETGTVEVWPAYVEGAP
jgi:hypothetical protein